MWNLTVYEFTTFHAKRSLTYSYVFSFWIVDSLRMRRNISYSYAYGALFITRFTLFAESKLRLLKSCFFIEIN